jgi:DNA helicase-2/ATP-dependent DNA helicase PcrA
VNEKERLEQAANERANQARYDDFLRRYGEIDVSQIAVPANGTISGTFIQKPNVADGELFARIQLGVGSSGLEADNIYIGPVRARPSRLGFKDDDPNRWEVYSWVEALAKLYQGQPHIAPEHDLDLRPAIVRRITYVGFEDQTYAEPITPVFPAPGVGNLRLPPAREQNSGSLGLSSSTSIPPLSSAEGEEDKSESPPNSSTASDGLARASLVAEILSQPRQIQLRQTLATLDEQQFEAIRLPGNRDMVIQGGPGTGKSLVAAKRVAFLLHKDAKEIGVTRGKVMLVGPTRAYVHHVQRLLRELHAPADRYVLTSIEEVFGDFLAETGLRSFVPNRHPQTPLAANKELYEFCGFAADEFRGWYEESYLESIQNPRGGQPSKAPYKDLSFGRKVMACYDYLRDLEVAVPLIAQTIRATMHGDESDSAEDVEAYVKIQSERWIEWFKSLPNASTISGNADVQWLLAMIAWHLSPTQIAHIKHVIVDEAQDLRPVEWEFLAAINGGNWTIIGDVNQNSIGDKKGIDKWKWTCKQLGIQYNLMLLERGYRSTSGISQLAECLIGNSNPRISSVLQNDDCPRIVKSTLGRLPLVVLEEAALNCLNFPDGQNAVVIAPSAVNLFVEVLTKAGWRRQENPIQWNVTIKGSLRQVTVSTPVEVRGLEFDSVVLVQPGDFVAKNELYMAITRAHRELTIVHSKGFPPSMHNCLIRCL